MDSRVMCIDMIENMNIINSMIENMNIINSRVMDSSMMTISMEKSRWI